MNSIRLFLTISIVATVVLANFLAVIQGYQESMTEAEVLFDQKLESFAHLLVKTTIFRPLPDDSSVHAATDLQIPDDAIHYQVRDGNGRLLLHSNQLGSKFNFERKSEKGYLNYQHFRWRYLTLYSNQQDHWILVMEKQDIRYKLAESVIIKSVYPIIIAIPAIALIIFLIIGRGLKPIGNLATNVHKKRASELSPIELEGIPLELSSLTEQINNLLARLEESMNREKHFASDAAHELRTPIAALNIQAKNLIDLYRNEAKAGKHLDDPPDKTGTIQTLEVIQELDEGVKRMSHLVEQILTLSRTTPKHYGDKFHDVDLRLLLKQLVARNYSLIEENQHEIELDYMAESNSKTSQNYVVKGDLFGLQTLFKNLLLNSIKYTPRNGSIKICLVSGEDKLIVQIMDSGPGISLEQRNRVFERFYRLGGDRNQSPIMGCGLGLAIVKQIADLHSAHLSLHDSQFMLANEVAIKSGLCVKLVFPRSERLNEKRMT